MNKKLLIGIGIIFVVVVLVVLKILVPNLSGSKELELTYKTNSGVPYKWEYKIEDESIVEFVKTKDITSEVTSEEDKKLNGGPIYTNYIFKGLKQGKTTITFKYINITDGSIDKEETITVKVDENKNISLNVIL